jgi:predicted restriction endonuclease
MPAYQNYEEYWKLTLEYTDFNDDKFLKTLQMIVNRIDELNSVKKYDFQSVDYQRLQEDILKEIPKTSTKENQLASTRKAINQCVKLGFVNSELQSYHHLAMDYLQARTDRKRKTLFSRIVYDNSSFNRSVTNESTINQINFLVDTLIEVGVLSKKDIEALMLVDIENTVRTYLTREEIEEYRDRADEIVFRDRKYNQVGYFYNILNKLDGICFVKDELYFTEDAKRIFGENIEPATKKRNPYLHLLYKNQLKEESLSIYQSERCMVERLDYPVLIASHIKPFVKSNDIEAYDVNNGILLSRNFDALFDLGDITFDTKGNIMVSTHISQDLRDNISKYRLDDSFINPERLEYMKYHRKYVYKG